MCSTGHVQNGILFNRRGLAYRKTEEMNLCWTSYSRNGVLLIGGGVAYRKTGKRTCVGALWSKWGSCSSGGVWRTAKRDSTGYCSSPPSTSSNLHGLPSTCSSLHGLLFIQPPPHATLPANVQQPLHGRPSTVYCSSSPPRGRPVHPALHTTGSCSSRGNATAHCSSNLSVFWERGSPDLPACGLWRGSRGGPAWPIFINTSSRPSRGAKPLVGWTTGELPQARPRQAGSRGGGEIKAGYLARCP